MRNFDAPIYKKLIEDSSVPEMRSFIENETSILKSVLAAEETVLDLGAGYGRAVEYIAPLVKKVIAVEINPSMIEDLKKVPERHPNIEVKAEDFFAMPPEAIGEADLIVILHNTLGTIENGNWESALKMVKERMVGGQKIFWSILRQEALETVGRAFYKTFEPMIGAIDEEKSDFNAGNMFTDNYSSHWFTDQDIERMKEIFEGSLAEQRFEHFTFLYSKELL